MFFTSTFSFLGEVTLVSHQYTHNPKDTSGHVCTEGRWRDLEGGWDAMGGWPCLASALHVTKYLVGRRCRYPVAPPSSPMNLACWFSFLKQFLGWLPNGDFSEAIHPSIFIS